MDPAPPMTEFRLMLYTLLVLYVYSITQYPGASRVGRGALYDKYVVGQEVHLDPSFFTEHV